MSKIKYVLCSCCPLLYSPELSEIRCNCFLNQMATISYVDDRNYICLKDYCPLNSITRRNGNSFTPPIVNNKGEYT